jgi:hypothetical protein
MDPLVNTRPEGAAATEEEEGPFGAESILPNPIRTGAVSERAVMCPPRRLRTSSRALTASAFSKKLTKAQVCTA